MSTYTLELTAIQIEVIILFLIMRFTFQMDAGVPHEKLLKAIELIGEQVIPLVRRGMDGE